MSWKLICATGAFGGVAPILLQLALDLTQGRRRIEAIGLSIVVGMAIYALLGGGLSLIWKETDLKKVFYIGLGLPSLLTIASGNISAPQLPPAPAPSIPTQSIPQQPARSPSLGSSRVTTPRFFASLVQPVFAQSTLPPNNIPDRQLMVVLDAGSLPADLAQAPLSLIFEPLGTVVAVRYGEVIVSVPSGAKSFRIEGSLATSDSVALPAIKGSTTRVRFSTDKRSWYGLLYSLGARPPPYQLTMTGSETSVPILDPKDPIALQVQLAASSESISGSQDSPRYRFTLSVNIPDALKEQISSVDYDLVYEPNPLLLTSNDPTKNFAAIYEGWGCYRTVGVTISFKNSNTRPRKRNFNMCDVLGWGA